MFYFFAGHKEPIFHWESRIWLSWKVSGFPPIFTNNAIQDRKIWFSDSYWSDTDTHTDSDAGSDTDSNTNTNSDTDTDSLGDSDTDLLPMTMIIKMTCNQKK